jgi:predicted nucleic acid-binding protein
MKIMLDTNVLVYAYDPAEPERQEQAIELLDRLRLSGSGRLSAQCLAEFFSAITRSYRNMPPRLNPTEALDAVGRLAAHFEVYPLTALTILEAGRGVRDYRLSYYDAQIWASARLNQSLVVFTEDFQPGQILEGVRFINPFGPEFKLSDWL